MICFRCKNVIDDNALACINCMLEVNRRMMRRHQYHPLRELEAGRGQFKIRYLGGRKHLQMFGCADSFCGENVAAGQRKETASLPQVMAGYFCDRCITAVRELIAEADVEQP